MEYAIGYAGDGYPCCPRASAAHRRAWPSTFREHWPSSAEIYLAGRRAPAAGPGSRNPVLAATYQRLLAEAEAAGPDREAQIEAARRAFYEGFVAEAIAAYLARAGAWTSPGSATAACSPAPTWPAGARRVEPPVTFDYGA